MSAAAFLAARSRRSILEFNDGVARPEGIEPPTSWSVARRSIQLS